MIALATSGSRRIPGVNLPTMSELGLDVVMANWRGVFGAPGISAAQKDALINFMTAVVRSPAWQKELETRKWTDVFMTEQPFLRELASDIAKTEAVMKDLGLA
jgi:putative tricarboxylic transport membrane protein